MQTFRLPSPVSTIQFGLRLAQRLRPGDILLLLGPLGSGKTTLVKGIAQGLGIRRSITSPTFIVRKRYPLLSPTLGIAALNHLDAYRLRSDSEVRGVLDELLPEDDNEVWVVEWGGRFKTSLPGSRTRIVQLEFSSRGGRRLRTWMLRPGRA